MNRFKTVVHYFPLIGIAALSLFAFFLFPFDRQFQVNVVVALAVTYPVWGIVHHYLRGDLSTGIIFEYILVSCFLAAGILSVIYI